MRCDLGPVDDPYEPPCVRCRRESKECYFSATRRKRKSLNGENAADGGEGIEDDYATRNRRRKTSYVREPPNIKQDPTERPGFSRSKSSTPPITAYNTLNPNIAGYEPRSPESQHRPEPYYINTAIGNEGLGHDQEVTNETAAALFQSPINTPGDALHLLLEASGRSEDLQLRGKSNQGEGDSSHHSIKPSLSSRNHHFPRPGQVRSRGHPEDKANLDPAIASNDLNNDISVSAREGLRIWSRLRFVRAGWFTAKEAISYIN